MTRLPRLAAALFYVALAAAANPAAALTAAERAGLEALRTGDMRKLVVADEAAAATDLPLAGRDGSETTLAARPGRLRLVNFWATWCAPCVEEMPLLAALRARQAPGGLEVIGIALDDSAAVREFVAELAIDYPILLDTPGRGDTSVRYGDTQGVLPYTVLVDARGRIAAVRAGSFSAESLDRFVAPVRVAP